MFNFFKKHKLIIIFTSAGIAAGFSYWKFIGCSSGTCPLTSNAGFMTVYGAFAGAFIGNAIQGFRNSTSK